MKYNQPYGISDPNGPYINGNPSTGQMGSIPPAASIEFPQREIVNLIADAGLATPDNADLHQLSKAVQSQLLISDDDAGTANQYQVTMSPAPTAYFKFMTVITKVANTNTAASTLNVNALGAKPIVRVDGTALTPGVLVAGMIVCFVYDGAAFQLVWASLRQNNQGVLTQNTTIFINGVTGDDNLYDGSSAVVVAGTIKGPFKTIQHGVDIAYKFSPSAAYAITIQIADATYNESVKTPSIPGPALIVSGNVGSPGNVIINGGNLNAFSVNGPNTATVQYLRFQNNPGQSSAGIGANGAGASVVVQNCISGVCGSWVFLGNGLGAVGIGSHTFAGSAPYLMASYRNGTINLGGGAVFTIAAPITVSATAIVVSGGQIEVPATGTPTFVGAGNVSGAKYQGFLNGVINTQGAGVNYFPGNSAGALSSGAQYG